MLGLREEARMRASYSARSIRTAACFMSGK
jgi:hypothetical protein